MEKHEIIMDAFSYLWDDQTNEAREVILKNYPFDPNNRPDMPMAKTAHIISETMVSDAWRVNPNLKMQVFKRDGFINRFDEKPLVLTAVLRLLSREFPSEFPHQKAWLVEETHNAYYELGSCTNRIRPTSREGKVDANNLVTTTMPYVLKRSNATIEEVGWELKPAGDSKEWNGLSDMFLNYVQKNPELKKLSYVKTWYPAVSNAFEK